MDAKENLWADMLVPTPAEPWDFLTLWSLFVVAGVSDGTLAWILARRLGWGTNLIPYYKRWWASDRPYGNALLRVVANLLMPVLYGVAAFLVVGGCVSGLCSTDELLSLRFPLWEVLLGWGIGSIGVVVGDLVRFRFRRPHRPPRPATTFMRRVAEDARSHGVALALLVGVVAAFGVLGDPLLLGVGGAAVLHSILARRAPSAGQRVRRGPSIRRPVSERGAAVLVTLVILLVLLVNASWIWAGNDVLRIERVNSSGVSTFDPTTRLTAFTHGFELGGNVSPEISGYASNLVANGIDLSDLYSNQPAPNQTIVINNGTQAFYHPVGAYFILVSACDLAVLSQTDYNLATSTSGPLALQLASSNFGTSLGLTVDGYQGNAGIVTSLAVAGSTGSVASFRCENPILVVNGTQISYEGRYFVIVTHFIALRGMLWLSEESRLDLNGEWTLATSAVNATIANAVGSAWTTAGAAAPIRGNVTILGAASLSVTHGAGVQNGGSETVSWSQLAGYTYLGAGSSSAGSLGSSVAFAFNLQAATVRWAETDICAILGVTTVLVARGVLWSATSRTDDDIPREIRNPDPRSDSTRQRRRLVVAVLTGIVVLSVLFIGFVINTSLANMAPPYFYSRYPTSLDIWYEDGVNANFSYLAVRIFLWEADRMVGLHVVGITNHTFEGDGLHVYNQTDADLWNPAGRIRLNRAEVWLGAPIPFRITFLRGSGQGFAGVNNFGTSIVVFPAMYSSTLSLVTTLLHEFGHALGLGHDPCSPIMTNDTASNTRLLLAPFGPLAFNSTYRSVYVNEELLNGTFAGLSGWGNLVGRANNVTYSTWGSVSRTTDSITYLNPGDNSLHEILWEHDVNRTSGSATYSSSILAAPSDVFLVSWSAAEELYIQASMAGFPAGAPPIGEC